MVMIHHPVPGALRLITDGKILGDTLLLGYYQNDFDWNNATEKVCYYGSRMIRIILVILISNGFKVFFLQMNQRHLLVLL